MADAEWKQKGNAAFSKGDWEGAVNAYSKAIKFNPKNDTYYSNRSAAYLKRGDYENALKDANKCIQLNTTNHKGYGRKGAAYHAMKKYDRAITTYKEGLKVCPDEEHLLKGLAAAKKANMESSKATQAVRKTEATRKAAKSRSKKAKKTEGVSDFVKQTRQELKLQMAAIQSQLDLINELAAMGEEEKLDLLFTLIDRDGDGTVDASELAMAMRKRNDDLSFQESIENAIDMVATFDTDGDAKLDPDEFRNYIDVMLKELGVSFAEFSEFLVIQILFSDDGDAEDGTNNAEVDHEDIEKEVKAREVLFEMLSDERMVELFRLFDTEGKGEVPFKEVAMGLYQMAHMDPYDDTTRDVLRLLLMMDPNPKRDKRQLNYEKFGRLIMATAATSNTPFDDIADDLTLAMDEKLSPAKLKELMVPDNVRETAKEMHRELKKNKGGDVKESMDPLSFGRLTRLFDLWDVDGDGDMTFDELTDGLRKFQNAAGIDRDVEQEAKLLFQHDDDGNMSLDKKEFARAMAFYAKKNQIDMHDLVDFMCVTTVMGEEGSQGFQEAYGRALGKDVIPKLKLASEAYLGDDDDVDMLN